MKHINFEEPSVEWPPAPDKLDELEENISKRIAIEQKKIDILNAKLEECKKKNMPIENAGCDFEPLRKAQEELKTAKVGLVKVATAKLMRNWKAGDRITVFADGYRAAERETGFELLDHTIAVNKANLHDWYFSGNVAELEIIEIRPDGRVVAKNRNSKTTYLGIPFTENTPIKFYKIQK